MTAEFSSPHICAALNAAGALELTAVDAPAGAVIRMDINADTPRMFCTQGQYLAPVEAPAGTRIRYRLFMGKRGITEAQTFIMPGVPSAQPVPSTLIPCTQNRDFLIYDWAARHEAVCRLVKETRPNLLFIGDSITHFWGGDPVDERMNDILQRSPQTWAAVTQGMCAANLGFGFDKLENALWRLRHGELDGAAQDAICVVLTGTNNLADNTDEEILVGVRAVCAEVMKRLPAATLVLQGFYPRNNHQRGTPEHIRALNEGLRAIAAQEGYIFTEPGKMLADENGHVPAELSDDGLHPNAAGYEKIAAVLGPLIQGLRFKR